MSRKWWTGMAVAAAVLAATALAAVESKSRSESRGADLTGMWTLDASRSDLPAGPGGRWRRDRSGPDDEARGRSGRGSGSRMPSVMQVTQKGAVVSFADSAGALVQVIRIGSPVGDPNSPGSVRELTGRWDDGTLIATGSGPRGGTVVRSYRLIEGGRALEVRTRREGLRGRPGGVPRGDSASDSEAGPRRFNRGEMTLVYRRAS